MSSKWPPTASHFGCFWHHLLQKVPSWRVPENALKNASKKCAKMSQKELSIWPGKVTKITKIRALGSKCAPSLQERSPGTQNTQKSPKMSSKITQNYENLVTQNPGNPRKQNQELARWRVLRAAHWVYIIYIYIYIYIWVDLINCRHPPAKGEKTDRAHSDFPGKSKLPWK